MPIVCPSPSEYKLFKNRTLVSAALDPSNSSHSVNNGRVCGWMSKYTHIFRSLCSKMH